MIYETYAPHPDLEALVKFYWTLEVPYDPANQKQKIIPDGCIEMTFNLEDPIKRYTSEKDYITHPRAMVMGQRTKSYFIEPAGNVKSFAICFYPYGFANFVNTPLGDMVDMEAPISQLFGESTGAELEQKMLDATDTQQRITIIESFLLDKLNQNKTVDHIVRNTVDTLMSSKGSPAIKTIVQGDLSKRRKLEREFKKQIGISPKQLGKVIRMQTALSLLLNKHENLTHVAYESEYFDQAHFTKDFKEFTGVTPKEFMGNDHMALSTLFYK